jgi:hypothetical protein
VDDVVEGLCDTVAMLAASLLRKDQFFIFQRFTRFAHSPRNASLLRELLRRVQQIRYSNALERSLLTSASDDGDSKKMVMSYGKERLLLAGWFEPVGAKFQISDILLVITTERALMMKKPIQTDCDVCPPDRLCPTPPKVAEDIPVKQILTVKRFYGDFMFSFSLDPDQLSTFRLKSSEFTLGSLDNALVRKAGQLLSALASGSGTASERCETEEKVLRCVEMKLKQCIAGKKGSPEAVPIPPVLFFSYVVKQNRKGKDQNRVIVVTDTTVYNFSENFWFLAEVLSESKIMELQSSHEVNRLVFYDVIDNDPGHCRLVLTFTREIPPPIDSGSAKKRMKKQFYNLEFGNEHLRTECVRCLEYLRALGRWHPRRDLFEPSDMVARNRED